MGDGGRGGERGGRGKGRGEGKREGERKRRGRGKGRRKVEGDSQTVGSSLLLPVLVIPQIMGGGEATVRHDEVGEGRGVDPVGMRNYDN